MKRIDWLSLEKKHRMRKNEFSEIFFEGVIF